VGLFGRSGRKQADQDGQPGFGTASENGVVRQYRYLLRAAPREAVESAHVQGLAVLDPFIRAAVVGTVRERLAAGERLTPDDLGAIAHVITDGEQRSPGIVIRALNPAILQRLAQQVTRAEAATELFEDYADWDGFEPAPAPDQEITLGAQEVGRHSAARPGQESTG
jgi:hypothetical protein